MSVKVLSHREVTVYTKGGPFTKQCLEVYLEDGVLSFYDHYEILRGGYKLKEGESFEVEDIFKND